MFEQSKHPRDFDGTLVVVGDGPELRVQRLPEMVAEVDVTRVKVAGVGRLDAEDGLDAVEGHAEGGVDHVHIRPVDDAVEAAGGLVHVDVGVGELGVLDDRGIVGSEQKRESLADLV